MRRKTHGTAQDDNGAVEGPDMQTINLYFEKYEILNVGHTAACVDGANNDTHTHTGIRRRARQRQQGGHHTVVVVAPFGETPPGDFNDELIEPILLGDFEQEPIEPTPVPTLPPVTGLALRLPWVLN